MPPSTGVPLPARQRQRASAPTIRKLASRRKGEEPMNATRDAPTSARDHRPAVWSHGSVGDRRLGLQHLRAIGEG